MHGDVIEQLAARLPKPTQIGDLIACPQNYALVDPVSAVKPGPRAKCLDVGTLGAFRDYLKANRDALDRATLVAHASSPAEVCLFGQLDSRTRDREMYVRAVCLETTAGFVGKFMPLEDFAIGLQVRFADLGDRKRVLGLLGTVKQEKVQTSQDDGITQTVTAKAGVALVQEVAVPNPVMLAPWRTFREVEQPLSPFVLRMQSGQNGGLPLAGLFEADAGTWRLEAISAVAAWLTRELDGTGVAILA